VSGNSSVGELVAILCHTDDCCPEIHYHKHDPDDQCFEVTDDFGNTARFGPDSLLLEVPRSCEPDSLLYRLSGVDGEEVYMTAGQHHELFDPATVKRIVKIGRRRGIAMKLARRHSKRMRRVDEVNYASLS